MKVHHPNHRAMQEMDQSKDSRRAERSGSSRRSHHADRSSQSTTDGGSRLEISAQAREAAHATSLAKNAPDVRESKIEELKQRIASGNYSVDPDQVADRLVDDHLEMSRRG